MEPQNRGFTPTDDEVADAHWVIEQYRQLSHSGDTWLQTQDASGQPRVVDRYEAARAEELLQWRAACGERDREKNEAIARVRATEESARNSLSPRG